MKYIVDNIYKECTDSFCEFAQDFNKSLSLESRRISSSFTIAVDYSLYDFDFTIDEAYHSSGNKGYNNDMPFKAISIVKRKISDYAEKDQYW